MVSSQLASAMVLDPEGQGQRLGELWEHQPVVLVFLRHYG